MTDKPDWGAIEAEYITGWSSLADLARKFGVSYKALEHRCSRGGWKEKRKQWRATTLQTLRAKVEEELAAEWGERLSAITLDHFRKTRRMLDLTPQAMEVLEEGLEEPRSLQTLKELTELAKNWCNVLSTCIRLEREMLGLQFEHPAIAIQYLTHLGYEVVDPVGGTVYAPQQASGVGQSS